MFIQYRKHKGWLLLAAKYQGNLIILQKYYKEWFKINN